MGSVSIRNRFWALVGVGILTMVSLMYPAKAQSPIGYGQRVEGVLEAPDFEAFYVFQAMEGDAVTITLDASDPTTLNPLLILLDPEQRRVIALDDDSGTQGGARLRHVVVESGAYLLKVMPSPKQPPQRGKFVLALTLTNPTPTPSPLAELPRLASLPPNGALRAELTDDARFRLYAVPIAKDEALQVKLTSEGDIPIGMYLYSADFENRLATAELGALLSFTAPTDGIYFLVVTRLAPSGVAIYRLKRGAGKEILPNISGAVRLVAGLPQTGALAPRFATLYQFEASGGSILDVNIQSTQTIGTFIALANTKFEQLAVGAGGLRGVSLPNTDTYYLIVARSGGLTDTSSGEYSLILGGALQPPPTATPQPSGSVTGISIGAELGGEIRPDQFVVYYRFEGKANTALVVELSADAVLNSALDPMLYLYQYGGRQPQLLAANDNRAEDDFNAAIEINLPADGLYLLVVTRAGAAEGTTSGPYRLKLKAK